MLLKLLKKLLGYYDDGDLSYICDYCENFIWFDKKINKKLDFNPHVCADIFSFYKCIWYYYNF